MTWQTNSNLFFLKGINLVIWDISHTYLYIYTKALTPPLMLCGLGLDLPFLKMDGLEVVVVVYAIALSESEILN